MSKVSDERMLEVREGLMKTITDEQEKIDGFKSPQLASDFLNPILRRIEVDAESSPDHTTPETVERDPREEAREDGWGVEEKHLGTVDVAGGKVVGHNIPLIGKKEYPAIEATRRRFRFLATQKEWKERIMQVAMNERNPKKRERAWREILIESCKEFGDPRCTG